MENILQSPKDIYKITIFNKQYPNSPPALLQAILPQTPVRTATFFTFTSMMFCPICQNARLKAPPLKEEARSPKNIPRAVLRSKSFTLPVSVLGPLSPSQCHTWAGVVGLQSPGSLWEEGAPAPPHHRGTVCRSRSGRGGQLESQERTAWVSPFSEK